MISFQIDRNIFSDEVISKAVYWESGLYTISRSLDGSVETISFDDNGKGVEDEKALRERFFKRLNDLKVQQIVNDETKDIRTILYIKAFAGSEDLE